MTFMIEQRSSSPTTMPGLRRRDTTRDARRHGGQADAAVNTRIRWSDGAGTDQLERLHGMATRVLDEHLGVDGLCQTCGAAWPCVSCVRAALALESQ
jgi:hypothetical protein